jgi:prepilin-type N-terminal cleavage/methylation domain-containing protein
MQKYQFGFTTIELIVSVAIFAVISAISTVILIRPQITSSVDTSVNTIASDIKAQQTKAMLGDSEGQSTSQAHGVYFELNQYTLFRGSTYTAGQPSNFVVSLDQNLSITDILPSNPLVFNKRSGETSPSTFPLIVKSDISTEQRTVSINRYGAISIN